MSVRPLAPISAVFGDVLPAHWIAATDDALDKIAVDLAASHAVLGTTGLATRHHVYILEPGRFDLPLVPGISVEIGEPGRLPTFTLSVQTDPVVEMTIDEVAITMWLSAELAQAWSRDARGVWAPATGDSAGPLTGLPIVVTAGVRADARGAVSLLKPTVAVPYAAMLGDTGILLEVAAIDPVHVILGNPPVELVDVVPDDFKGVWLPKLTFRYLRDGAALPPLVVTDATIGSGGFSGAVAFGAQDAAAIDAATLDRWRADPDDAPADVIVGQLEGMAVVLHHVGLTFAQSLPSGGALAGYAWLPFIDDWLRLKATLGGPDGQLMIEVGSASEPLVSLENDWLEIEADTIEYLHRDGEHYAAVSGTIRLKRPALDWPKVRIERLLVGADGSIEIDGGWIDLPEAVTLDFHGFSLQITAVGLGNDTTEAERRQWLGFSGGISLVDGVPLAASVDGLKVSWRPDVPDDEPDVTLTGIGVELDIPGALRLEGSVSYAPYEMDGLRGELFRGRVELELYALKTEIAAQIIVGRLEQTVDGESLTVLMLVLDADLPTPLPLGCSGTALFSLSGLFGLHVAPDRRLTDGEPEGWHAWYKRPEPAYDARAIDKWAPAPGHMAFGVGVGVGTQFDDGYSLNVAALVALLLPGPVILVEGTANLLQARSGDDRDGAFHALAVFDGNADTFQINVDVDFDLASVISITGGLEAFFDFNDFGRWHLHLGQREPDSKRIQAELLALLTAATYLMIDASGLQTGAKVQFDWRAELGPVEIALLARIGVDAGIFWKPAQLEGRLDLAGELALKVFGIGFRLLLEMLLEASAPAPYWIHGRARVALSLPWPLPDLDVAVELEWKETAEPQPVPFLKSAVLVHHRAHELGWEMATSEGSAPIVPVDATAVLSFARPLTGWSQRRDSERLLPVEPDAIGDWQIAYHLRSLMLEKKQAGSYDGNRVRTYPLVDDINDLEFDIGDPLRAVLPTPDAQEPQLQLWSRSPFERASRAWREGVENIGPVLRTRTVAPRRCVDWNATADGTVYPLEFSHRGLSFTADLPRAGMEPVVRSEALHIARLTVAFPEPAGEVELDLLTRPDILVEAFAGGERVATSGRVGGSGRVTLTANRIDSVRVRHHGVVMQETLRLRAVCWKSSRDIVDEQASSPVPPPRTDPQELLSSLVLEPHTLYRLTVVTEAERGRDGDLRATGKQTSTFYFRTGGGPGSDHDYLRLWRDESAAPMRTFRGTPPERLATYVSRSSPADGTIGHYRDDDLAVEFDEGYVTALYRRNERLDIIVTDGNGRRIGDAGGEWGAGLLPLAHAALLTWICARERAGLPPAEIERPPGAPVLRHRVNGLAARRRYAAEVVLRARGRERATGYRFSFVTSRYVSVEEHLASGLTADGRQPVRLATARAGATLDPRVGAEASALARALADRRRELRRLIDISAAAPLDDIHLALESATRAAKTRADASAARFAEVANTLGFEWRPLPPACEFSVYRLTDGDVVLFESAEPLDWSRIDVRLVAAGRSTTLYPLWNSDGTRAFLFVASGRLDAAPVLHFGWTGDVPDLPVITRWDAALDRTAPVRASVTLTLAPTRRE